MCPPLPWLVPDRVSSMVVGVVLGVTLPHRLPAQQTVDDPWTVSDEEIERARSAPLFASSEVLELTLAAPFRTIAREDRGDDAVERDATLTWTEAGRDVSLGIKVQTRGDWRRDRRNCDFPPLWLDLPKDDPALPGTVFEGQNRLKLYVTCRKNRDDYERYILREYLVYPMYNAVTDFSFRARLVRIRYEDTDERGEPFTRYAFLLEHKDAMAARNRAVPVEAPVVHPARMSGDEAVLLAVFNYMIGMTDWTQVYLHNVEAIRLMDDGRVLPVGYDFDWSGLVNTRYAVPDESLSIRNVRERTYQGFCYDVDIDAVFGRLLEARARIVSMWSDFDLVDEDGREDALDYLEQFFERATDPARRDRIVRDCTRIPR